MKTWSVTEDKPSVHFVRSSDPGDGGSGKQGAQIKAGIEHPAYTEETTLAPEAYETPGGRSGTEKTGETTVPIGFEPAVYVSRSSTCEPFSARSVRCTALTADRDSEATRF